MYIACKDYIEYIINIMSIMIGVQQLRKSNARKANSHIMLQYFKTAIFKMIE